ncbi:hypothetical protein DPMN_004914 [Dreissena polymorpha]|uniref:Copper type II ascorbate-dependent monooxygenase N-terminal domain-containing protein n=1 Tax=Dreissena polymorpha TaxID=45954 RepID=A0A9D4MSJ1_DREPO|nr:hypothetical protein DPMN_004914 [Dreissena polymorpha]
MKTRKTTEASCGVHTRGTKSLFLLNPDKGDGIIAETKIKHFDFLNLNYMVPNDTTTYIYRAFIMPPLGKNHMIKYEPIITPGNEKHVHHILLSRCKVPFLTARITYWPGPLAERYL